MSDQEEKADLFEADISKPDENGTGPPNFPSTKVAYASINKYR